jgi:hypothetical protein
VRASLAALLLVGLAAAVIACENDGGDSASNEDGAATAADSTPGAAGATSTPGGELTPEEFFQQVKTALDASTAGAAAVSDPQINDDDTLDAAEKAAVLANLDAQLQVRNDLRVALAALPAPDEAEGATNSLLAAVDAEIALLESLRPEFESADSPDDLQALAGQLFSGLQPAGPFQQSSEACSALQAVANDNDVAVTLPC